MAAQRVYGKHLLLKAGIWYFRLALPADIRNRSGRREVRLSLGTGYARIASSYATALNTSKCQLYKTIRSNIMANITPDEIKKYIFAYFKKTLESMWDTMLDSPHSSTEELEKTISNVTKFKNNAKTNFALRNTKPADEAVNELINTNDLNVETGSRDYTRLGVEVLKAYVDVAEVLLHRLKGDHRAEESIVSAYATIPRQDVSEALPKQNPVLLFDLIDEYCADRIARNRWKGRGIDENRRKFTRLKLILGNVPVRGLCHASATHVRDVMQKLPARLDGKQYAGKQLSELLTIEGAKRLSPKTINDELTLASSLFKFAQRKGLVSINIFEDSTIADSTAAEEKREEFTQDDIARIFEREAYSKYCGDDSARFWIPLLALFTGARLSELCQLKTDDVYCLDDLLILDINENTPDKRLKNPGSKRLIPVHPILRDALGFDRFVSQAKDAGQDRLFPSVPYIQKRYSHKPSQDFGRYLKALGGFQKKSFHSFRHGFIMNLRNQGISSEVIASVTGHKGRGTGPIPDNYKKKHDPHFLMEDVISKLTFTVDLASPLAPPL